MIVATHPLSQNPPLLTRFLYALMQHAGRVLIILLCLLPGAPCAAERLRLATTTSTENSGLLTVLHPPFERRTGATIDVIVVGTGKALRLGENGDVDLVMVHAPAAEQDFVANGFGMRRWPLMHNDFVILGPLDDPARLAASGDAREAMQRLLAGAFPFVSRGDNSGTHRKELELWRMTGQTPQGRWHMEIGQGMGAALQVADNKQAYVLSDRATWLSYRNTLQLALHYHGDPALRNPYHMIIVNPARHPHVRYELAKKYVDYARSERGQDIIRNFRVGGEVLFTPDVLPAAGK